MKTYIHIERETYINIFINIFTHFFIDVYIPDIQKYKYEYIGTNIHTHSHTYYWAAVTATCTGSMAHKVLLSHTSTMGHLRQLLKHLRARHKQNHLLWISRKICCLWHFKVLQKVSGLTYFNSGLIYEVPKVFLQLLVLLVIALQRFIA